jgi:hypothetical protein
MSLLSSWARWRPNGPPFVLDEDREYLLSTRSASHIVTSSSWRQAYTRPDFGAPGDHRLHLGLLPVPFIGSLAEADIYILLLNPGLSPTDYFGEYEREDFRRHRLQTLRQRFGRTLPFGMLDPRFSWHGGYGWWHEKLAGVIGQVAESRGIPFATARAQVARRVAAIELLPYHSSVFRDGGQWLRRLPSVQLARSFVHDTVLPKVRRGEATVIVTRQAAQWHLPRHRGIVV